MMIDPGYSLREFRDDAGYSLHEFRDDAEGGTPSSRKLRSSYPGSTRRIDVERVNE
jgi:hypothetical protein